MPKHLVTRGTAMLHSGERLSSQTALLRSEAVAFNMKTVVTASVLAAV
jgi:hypothetical protein